MFVLSKNKGRVDVHSLLFIFSFINLIHCRLGEEIEVNVNPAEPVVSNY